MALTRGKMTKDTIYIYDDEVGRVQLVENSGTDLTVVNSARVSFGVEKSTLDERDRKLIDYLVKNRHTSTLEHCNVTFKFVVPLYVRSQHHRHRTWSYNEISRRYTSVDMKFYEPKSFRTQHETNRQASNSDKINPNINDCGVKTTIPVSAYYASDAVKWHHVKSLGLYEDLVSRGVCREQARGVLPQNLYTEYYGTVSLLNALKFIDLRDHDGAQWEIQQVAKAMLEFLSELYPVTVESYKKHRQGG